MNEAGYTFEWPMWGMSLGEQRPGLEGGLRIENSLVYQPTWAQWAELELGAVIDDYCQQLVVAERIGLDVPRLPPPCLLRVSAADPDGDPEPTEEEHQMAAKATVAAFRLYGTGDFVNPNETGTYVTHPSGRVSREVSPLRCAFYDWSPADPYLVTVTDLENLEHLMSACWFVAEDPQHANAALAVENFVLSFGSVTPPAERGLHRFIALEALFGGIRDTRHGAPFDVRVAHTVPEQEEEVRDWILGRSIKLRNDLAHRLARSVPDSDPDPRVVGGRGRFGR